MCCGGGGSGESKVAVAELERKSWAGQLKEA
jgi:hypothetical protein